MYVLLEKMQRKYKMVHTGALLRKRAQVNLGDVPHLNIFKGNQKCFNKTIFSSKGAGVSHYFHACGLNYRMQFYVMACPPESITVGIPF